MDVTDGVENQLIRLQDISGFLEAESLDDNLLQLAEKTAKILEARHCSIMLLNEGEPGKSAHESLRQLWLAGRSCIQGIGA